jgi:hypothetical protein
MEKLRMRERKSEKILNDKEIIEKALSANFEITINTGHYENMKLSVGRSTIIANKDKSIITHEEEKEIMKDMFLDCIEDVIRQTNFSLSQFNRQAESGFPKILGERVKTASSKISIDEIEIED